MKEIAKIYLSICSRRSPEWGSILRVQQMMQYSAQFGYTTSLVPRVGESLICRARNNTLLDFIERTEYKFLMFLDDDIEPENDTIIKLIQADKKVIGGFYRLKRQDKAQTAVRIYEPIDGRLDYNEILKQRLVTEVEYISGGCMLIHRDVITSMVKFYSSLAYDQNGTNKVAYAFFQPYIYKHKSGFREYLSEDWAFCQRARDIGYKVWAHGGVRCGHWGLTKYDFEEPCHSQEQ